MLDIRVNRIELAIASGMVCNAAGRCDQPWFVCAKLCAKPARRQSIDPRRGSGTRGQFMINIPKQQIQGAYHRRIGDIGVTAISDGFLDGSMQVLRNISPEEATGILTASFRPARRTSVNAFLIYSAGRLALVDTGSGTHPPTTARQGGTHRQPTAGKVLANIKAAGVDPASIDTVILTHMHPDHSAGLADRNTGQCH